MYFQKKAWADSQVMLAWLEQFDVDTKHIAEKHGTRILGFDGLGSHMHVNSISGKVRRIGYFLRVRASALR